jgi:hypothetical protein
MSWKAAVSAETDLSRLVAFATHAIASAKRESPEIREAQHSLRVAADDDLEGTRFAVMRIAVEAADIIDEKRFFGDKSVSTSSWDEWWSDPKASSSSSDPGPRYYIHYVDESCRTPYGALGDVARAFTAPHTYKLMNLCCFENGEHRVIAKLLKGAKHWNGTSLITEGEREALGKG